MQELKHIKAQDFKRQVLNEMSHKPIEQSAPEQVETLTYLSYLPNALSLATGSFFVFYLTQGYPTATMIGLVVILTAVLTFNEYAKRSLLAGVFRKKFISNKMPVFSAVALIIAIGVSMASSYEGGKQLVLENSTAPTLSASSAITGLEGKLADVKESIKKQQGTTWKGVITVDANKNLKRLYPIQAALESEIAQYRAEDKLKQNASTLKHNHKTMNFGYVLGVLAILADVVLFLLMRSIYKLKANLFKVLTYRSTAPTLSAPKNVDPGADAPGFSQDNAVLNVLNAYDSKEILNYAVKGAKVQASAYRQRKTPHARNTVNHLENFITAAKEVTAV